MVRSFHVLFLASLLILGACASKMRDQMQAYREAYAAGDYVKAQTLLEKSVLKKDSKSLLLWHLEKGTVALAAKDFDNSINHFQQSLDLIDRLYTKRLSAKAASLLINDASDEFYGASYERSYAHYFLAQALYQRYGKTQNKLDLQGSRATILAWDTYFTELQRSSTYKTLYNTDLMLKVFGGQVHELSEIRNDRQIALQLYKDALKILENQAGIYSLYNKKSIDYVREYESALKAEKPAPLKLYEKTQAYAEVEDFLHYKILSLTKEIRSHDLAKEIKVLSPKEEIKKKVQGPKSNVVLVLEEGLIPAKKGKPFNFGIKGAMGSVNNPSAKNFIATVGVEALTLFAMNKLGMVPTQAAGAGNFMFAHGVTKLAVQEAAIEFELPMIDTVPLVQRLQLFVLDEKGTIVQQQPFPVISENGDIARVVLEEDVVARYTKTGIRIAVKHIAAIVLAMGVYQSLKRGNDGDFLAKSAAMATYVGASKGIAAMEKADTRHWTTLPQAIRLAELSLKPGLYKIAIGLYSGDKAPTSPTKVLGDVEVKGPDKFMTTFRL